MERARAVSKPVTAEEPWFTGSVRGPVEHTAAKKRRFDHFDRMANCVRKIHSLGGGNIRHGRGRSETRNYSSKFEREL